MEPHEYDEIIRNLVRIAAHQETINERHNAITERLAAAIEALKAFNARQLAIHEDVKTTLARLETLVARMWRTEENGRDA